jgi:L-threonylcarbamoyladenylate synthase
MNNIKQAISILKKGEVVVYPTDTAYAIGCKFKNKKGITKILKIKKRKDTKFTLIAASLAQVKKYFKLNACQIKLVEKYWPGPVSIVVSEKYSVRVPDNKIARQLARGAGMPIIATSLNISGEPTIYDLRKCKDALQCVFTINAGPLTKRKTSAIVKCLSNKKIKIIRHGSQRIKLSP